MTSALSERATVRRRADQSGFSRNTKPPALAGGRSQIKQIGGVTQIQICYHPDNEIAKGLYLQVGFKEIGMDESGKDMQAVKQV